MVKTPRLVNSLAALRQTNRALQAPIAFIESQRCDASRHSSIGGVRIEQPGRSARFLTELCYAAATISRMTSASENGIFFVMARPRESCSGSPPESRSSTI